jgi:hypothetical protein
LPLPLGEVPQFANWGGEGVLALSVMPCGMPALP